MLSDRAICFRTRKHGFVISHLSHADDIIIFLQANQESVAHLNQCLDHFVVILGQKINHSKSNFYIHPKFVNDWQLPHVTLSGFQHGTMLFFYLGVSIYRGFVKLSLFLDIRQKLSNKIHSWSHRQLSFGGRLALIKSTLATIPLRIFQVMEPPQLVLYQLEHMIARFFWGTIGEARKIH